MEAQKIAKWVSEIESLTAIARSHPHAPCEAFVHGKMAIFDEMIVALFSNHLRMLSTTNLFQL